MSDTNKPVASGGPKVTMAEVITTDNVPSYGSTSSADKAKVRRTHSVIYCVHGKVAADCCDADALNIKTIQSNDVHCHRFNQRDLGIDKAARKKLIIASVLCVSFMTVEIVGGVLSGSLAIATDAAHLLSDLAAFMISLLAIWISGRRSTKRLSFGFYRAEVVGALISILLIWVLTAVLVVMAVDRIRNKDYDIDAIIMLIAASLGILVNVIMGCSLHDHGHGHGGHGHGHSHSPDHKDEAHVELGQEDHAHKPSIRDNMNVRAALLHVIGDFIQSIGVFAAALIIYFKPEWKIVDPICTILFAVIVMFTTVSIVKDAVLVLMEAAPEYLDYQEVMETFLSINGVVRVHNLRIWVLNVSKIALAAHLAVEPNTDTELVLREATVKIHAKYDIFETTLQIEVFGEDMENCEACVNPT